MQDQRHVCISTHGLDGRLAVTPETSVELANVECRRQHFMDWDLQQFEGLETTHDKS